MEHIRLLTHERSSLLQDEQGLLLSETALVEKMFSE